MSIIAGIDFETLSVRVSLFDKREGRLGSGVAEYPLNRSTHDPNFATQGNAAQMDALCPPFATYLPDEKEAAVYDKIYSLYRELYFSLGVPDAPAARIGHVLPTLRKIASDIPERK